MPGSPLKKNYICQIKQIISSYTPKKHYPKSTNKKNIRKNCKPKDIEVFSNCFQYKIPIQSKKPGQNDYFQFLFFQSGIFNINKVHVSNIREKREQQRQKANQSINERNLKSLYFFPTQTIVQCQYDLQNKFHREMIFYCPKQFLIINNFHHGKLHLSQFNFNLKDLILVITVFQMDKITNVKDYSLTEETSLPFQPNKQPTCKLKVILQKYFKDKQLTKMIYQLTEGQIEWLKPIQTRTQSSSYFGLLQNQYPEGLGLLFNRKNSNTRTKQQSKIQLQQSLGWQLYFGLFRQGLLDDIGQIWFNDGSSYFGQFLNGQFSGLGQYYSAKPVLNIDIQLPDQFFEYKDYNQTIKKAQFFQLVKKYYFLSQKQVRNKDRINFIHHQYAKLKKVYLQSKKKNYIPLKHLFEKKNSKEENSEQNSKQIDDLVDKFNQTDEDQRHKNKYQQNSDKSMHKKEEIPEIFRKIMVSNPKSQKLSDPRKQSSKFDRINTDPHHNLISQKIFDLNSRSGTNFESQTPKIKDSQNSQKGFNPKNYFKNNHQEGQSPKTNSSKQKFYENQQIDLGVEEVGWNYFKNKQSNSLFSKDQRIDDIQKQYGRQNPKPFKTPQYFIIQNSKTHPKFGSNNSLTPDLPRNGLIKNIYRYSSPLKKEIYLFHDDKYIKDDKENEQTLKKYQKAISNTKKKKIFYHQQPSNN